MIGVGPGSTKKDAISNKGGRTQSLLDMVHLRKFMNLSMVHQLIGVQLRTHCLKHLLLQDMQKTTENNRSEKGVKVFLKYVDDLN